MTLHISEAEVQQVLTMPMALQAVEEISRKQATGEVLVHPRRRFELPSGAFFHYMAAADFTAGFLAMKQYTFVRGKIRFLVPLYEIASGDLVAMIEADYMGQLRTGAASGVATKYLARRDASVVAIIGTGGQAKTQLEAIAAVRKLSSARVYGRNADRRKRFAEEMSQKIGVPVEPADSSSEAARGAHIICTATTASQPVLIGADLASGLHINAIGANHARSGRQCGRHCRGLHRPIAPGSRRSDHRVQRGRNLLDRCKETIRCGRRKSRRQNQRHRSDPVQVQRNRVVGSSRSNARLRASQRSRAPLALLV